MPDTHRTEFSVTRNQVDAFRLARQHLLERAPAGALLSVAAQMGGAQAQLLSAAKISLGIRVADLSIAQIDEAIQNRALVKTACMRRTLFLVPAEKLAIFARGTARRAEKEVSWAIKKGVSRRELDAVIDATLQALDQPLTRTEIAERVCHTLGIQPRTVDGGGWGSTRSLAAVPVGPLDYPTVDLLHVVAARGVVCYGPNLGNELTFVRADAYIPGWQDLLTEAAEDGLLRIYLGAYGPAAPADFAAWAGLSLAEARVIWARNQHDLVAGQIDGRTVAILAEDVPMLAKSGLTTPIIRLLPYFDSFLLGHKEKEHLSTPAHRPHIYRPQGWIAPVVLVDGRAAGLWEYAMVKNRLDVQAKLFAHVALPIESEITSEAQSLARFFGLETGSVKIEFFDPASI